MIYFILFVCLLFISNVKNVFNGLLKKNKNWPLFSQKSSLPTFRRFGSLIIW